MEFPFVLGAIIGAEEHDGAVECLRGTEEGQRPARQAVLRQVEEIGFAVGVVRDCVGALEQPVISVRLAHDARAQRLLELYHADQCVFRSQHWERIYRGLAQIDDA